MSTNTPWTIWLTGLPASGKTTLARALQDRLRAIGPAPVLLDSDELRGVLSSGDAYTPAARDAVYGGIVRLAGLLNRQGFCVIIAATGHRRDFRDAARATLPRFAEVWVRCAPEVVRARDPKGLYRRASAGAISNLPGVDVAYEPPEKPALIIDSDRQSVDAAVDALLSSISSLSGT